MSGYTPSTLTPEYIQCIKKDGNPILINLTHLISISPNGKDSAVIVLPQGAVEVQQQYDEVVSFIVKAYNERISLQEKENKN